MTLSRKIAHTIVKHNTSIDVVERVLRSYSLLSLLPAIHKQVLHMATSQSKETTIMIESPFTLESDTVEHIKKIIGGSGINHETHINKNLLAGFKARYKGKMYDGSAERIIKQLMN